MKKEYEAKIRPCLFIPSNEFNGIIRDIMGGRAEYRLDGMSIVQKDGKYLEDETEIYPKLAEHFGVREVTSIHVDFRMYETSADGTCINVWVAYKD